MGRRSRLAAEWGEIMTAHEQSNAKTRARQKTGDYQLLAMILLSDQGAVDISLGPVLSVIP